MGEDVIAGKAPVSDKDRKAAIRVAVYELAESGKFVFELPGLDNDIQIPLGKQIIERNGVE